MKIDKMEPRPCPFCNSERLIILQDENYWVACLNCCAEGPDGMNGKEAIARWNGVYTEKEAYEN